MPDLCTSGALSARLSADAALLKTVVGDTFAVIIRNIATVVASLSIAFSANWTLALVVLAVVPLLGLEGFVRIRFLQGFSADAKVLLGSLN
jgi:ATP-binding cassette subfamily B (MDR/TAP) protein 1